KGREWKITKAMEDDLIDWINEHLKQSECIGARRLANMLNEKWSPIMTQQEESKGGGGKVKIKVKGEIEKKKKKPWSVSKDTIRRHLIAIGNKSRATTRQPFLNPQQKQKRVHVAEFALANWDITKLVYLDQTYVQDHARPN